MDLTPVRESLVKAAKGDVDLALDQLHRIWGENLEELMNGLSSEVSISSSVFDLHPPLKPTEEWIRCELNELSIPTFTISDKEVLLSLRREGYDYVIVPYDLNVKSGVSYGIIGPGHLVPYGVIYLSTPVGIIDLVTGGVVWNGLVSTRDYPSGGFRTGYEEICYGWDYDLLHVLTNKIEFRKTESLAEKLCKW